MAQIINTNVASLNTQRNLNSSQSSLGVALQRLSSGLRINSARDDAAGLAISERFTAQIRGLNQAARNSSDGISLAQTAEGDLAQITNNLQRIRELAVQSANATNSSSDRAALQLEAAELISEIDRVASTSAFNGVKLLDGNFASQQFQVGANAGETVNISSIASARTAALGQQFSATSTAGTAVGAADLTAGQLTINTVDVGAVAADAATIAAAITATGSDVSATATNAQTAITLNSVIGTVAVTGVATENTQTAIVGTDGGAGGQAFILTIDTIEAANVTFAASETVATAGIAAELDSDFATFLAGNTGYSVTSGSLSGGDLVLSKADGTAITFDTSTSTLSGVAASVTESETTAGVVAVTAAAPTYALSVDGNALDFATVGSDGTITGAEVATLIDALAGYTSSYTGTSLSITKADGSNIVLVESGADSDATEGLVADGTGGAATETYRGTVSVTSINNDLVIAGTSPAAAGLSVETVTAVLGGVTVANTDVSSVAGANSAIASIDAALTTINNSRASLGAIQNRFDSIVSSISTSVENLSAARSRIRDADFAQETAALTRNQILQQAGVSILAQANALPQLALSLLQ